MYFADLQAVGSVFLKPELLFCLMRVNIYLEPRKTLHLKESSRFLVASQPVG